VGNSEIRPLTGLRGIAACWVVIFHFRGNEAEGYTGQIVKHGYLAVDIFFVLSGFVMARSYKHLFQKGFGSRHYVTFLIRRLARVWPLYAVVTLVYTLLYIGGFGSSRIPSTRLPYLLPLNLGMVQAWGIGESIDRPAWSISTEFGAYLLFPLLAFLTVFSRGIVVILVGVSAFLGLGLLAAFAQPRGLSGPLDLAESSNTIWPLLRCLSEFSLGLITYRVALIPAARRLASTSAFLWLQASIILILLTLRGTDTC
jgi:peptidoglycan/LPS O-acetylase OafA/YrhL